MERKYHWDIADRVAALRCGRLELSLNPTFVTARRYLFTDSPLYVLLWACWRQIDMGVVVVSVCQWLALTLLSQRVVYTEGALFMAPFGGWTGKNGMHHRTAQCQSAALLSLLLNLKSLKSYSTVPTNNVIPILFYSFLKNALHSWFLLSLTLLICHLALVTSTTLSKNLSYHLSSRNLLWIA